MHIYASLLTTARTHKHTQTHTHTNTQTHTHKHTQTHTHTHAHTHTHIHVHVHTHTDIHIHTFVTTLKGVRSVAPCELLVTLTTRYSSGTAAEFRGLLFLEEGFDLTFARCTEGEFVDFFIDLGGWELDVVLDWEWDAQDRE